ncbi:pyrroline-5-carboxylate reductase [Trichophyton mentagrophytes]|uniref:Pyrroline-5-carboxylate reductase n=3 Tax=Trichophyton TaxID=5550 RepID=A0A9P4YGJ5_9EURO|nr:pyrroline-5-carboxylate reductase [Trichophyton tonsurans CBS 112818]EZF33370.1 pyrroline-5-carboxylate reductase [Trichophyton interdigitale H6]KAF3893370.1 Pyrroline-5-carboxylate reductase [Trichophyton interdigitale]KDB21402.1 pyrroline-5-carboxylate reductase [Trichophyton interdigitale MR816]GBF64878.1 pyrroline-5-carboxylate reductase [Trichophyton mentagrophytes]
MSSFMDGTLSLGHSGTTVTFLGCGTLGTSILSGVMASLSEPRSSSAYPPPSGSATPSEGLPVHQIPSKFIACVRRPESVKRIQHILSPYNLPLTILQNENVKGVTDGDVIVLGCKPYMLSEVLNVPGMREALKGKLLVSILAGVPAEQIEEVLYKDSDIDMADRCRVVRAMPNTAAIVRESMTVIASTNPPLTHFQSTIVSWIFTRVGRVITLPPHIMDASTALAGSGTAFVALVLEALADGAVAMGLPRAESQLMAAQVMRGTAGMVLNGEHPALIREKTSTPGGCTIGGLLVLEEGRVRGAIARSVREATVVASQLGKGVQGVNGTRF